MLSWSTFGHVGTAAATAVPTTACPACAPSDQSGVAARSGAAASLSHRLTVSQSHSLTVSVSQSHSLAEGTDRTC
eukprot:4953465-Pyramimonas_sp.AAC.2